MLGYIESGKQAGRHGHGRRRGAVAAPGYYVKPTVLVNVKPDMRVVREEIFGPVLVAQRFDDLDEIAAHGQRHPYGLGASVWTNDFSAVIGSCRRSRPARSG